MKKIALINDLSGFGKCSLTAAIPVISVMGIQACPLPTAVLSAQTGFEDYFCDDFTDRMDCFTNKWKKMNVSFDGIYSGYLANPVQIGKVISFLDKFQEEETLYLADPVMGDYGKTYNMFREEFLDGMKELVLRADVITPNLTELCLLAGVAYDRLIADCEQSDYIPRIQELCRQLQKNRNKKLTVVVTGIVRNTPNGQYVGNLVMSDEKDFFVENPYTGRGFSGTGDLFASVLCGGLVNGLSMKASVTKATNFLELGIKEATRKNIPSNHGIPFEKYLTTLCDLV